MATIDTTAISGEPKHFVIHDRNVGRLQWSGTADSAIDALRALDADVGIDPNGEGLEVIAESYSIREVSAEKRAEVEAWWDRGGHAWDAPDL